MTFPKEYAILYEVMSLKSHKKKIAVPIIISVVVILYCIVYFGFLITLLGGIWKYVLGIVPLALAAVMVMVCIERIKEIRKGEEDDLSQY